MSYYHAGKCVRCNCAPCRCEVHCPPSGVCPNGVSESFIPFSVSHPGTQLGIDAQGNPQIITFSGFSPGGSGAILYLQEGEWESGTITFREDMGFGTAFVVPARTVLKRIQVLFSTTSGMFFEPGSTIYPFVCLAISNSINLVYTVLQDTITYTEPYIGGLSYPKHTLRRGSLSNINIPLEEGTLAAIVMGIRGENVTTDQVAQFVMAGGLLFA